MYDGKTDQLRTCSVFKGPYGEKVFSDFSIIHRMKKLVLGFKNIILTVLSMHIIRSVYHMTYSNVNNTLNNKY